MSETDNLLKIQRIVNLLDSTFKMITIGIALKNSIKKEFSKDEKKDSEKQQNNQNSNSSSQTQQPQNSVPQNNSTQNFNHILNKNSFLKYLNKKNE